MFENLLNLAKPAKSQTLIDSTTVPVEYTVQRDPTSNTNMAFADIYGTCQWSSLPEWISMAMAHVNGHHCINGYIWHMSMAKGCCMENIWQMRHF
jgi:hypothetical protein